MVVKIRLLVQKKEQKKREKIEKAVVVNSWYWLKMEREEQQIFVWVAQKDGASQHSQVFGNLLD